MHTHIDKHTYIYSVCVYIAKKTYVRLKRDNSNPCFFQNSLDNDPHLFIYLGLNFTCFGVHLLLHLVETKYYTC